jgi:transposase
MIQDWCWGRRPALMTAPLSNDLRLRVVRAIEAGLSRRAAAAKFDVSIASAVRWYQRYKRTGSVEPDAIGGDRHSHRAEAHAAKVLGWIEEQQDLTLVEIAARLTVTTIRSKKDRSCQRAATRRCDGRPPGLV